MRRSVWLLWVLVTPVFAQIQPETIGKSTVAQPAATWFMSHDAVGPAYIFDAATGDMQGLLSLSGFTPAVAVNTRQQELYAAESFYARGTRGARTDVLTIYDMATLSPIDEVEIPQKIAALPFPQYIELMDDDRHLGVFNLTPAFSVTVVDTKERTFVGEISTPGCALVMRTVQRAFLQMCGDGTLQMVRLDSQGKEAERTRSKKFFDVEDDPVFDKPVRTQAGWLLTSYHGKVFDIAVDGDRISISKPWSMLTEDDKAEGWRPGGGQFVTYHQAQDLMFVLMNPGGEFAHDSAGTEVWLFDRGAQRRVGRIPIEAHGTNLFVSQDDAPLLAVTGEDQQLHVYDVGTLKHVRTISQAGVAPGLLQGF